MNGEGVIVDEVFCFGEETQLTVLKTSLFFVGDGFSVYDSKGTVLFRVDSYGPLYKDNEELVLMGASGNCLLTVRKKKRSLHNRWEGFLGQRFEGHEPIFSVRRHSMMGQSNMTVEMYSNPGEEFQIEGSYSCGCCKVYNEAGECVAQIKKKLDISTNVMLGMDVFTLFLKPRFDAAFAMGLVLVLDHINGVFGADGNDVDPSNLSLAPRSQSKNGDVL